MLVKVVRLAAETVDTIAKVSMVNSPAFVPLLTIFLLEGGCGFCYIGVYTPFDMNNVSLEGIEETRKCYCLAARKRARKLTRRYEAALRPYGLRATQFSVLAALAQTGPVPVSKLAGILGLERTTLTRIAGVLERDGLLSIVRGDDGRVRVLGIGTKGKRALAAALPAWKRVQDELAKGGER